MKVSYNDTLSPIVTAVLVVLKLAGVVHWSWWLVLAPLWGSLLFAVVLYGVVITILPSGPDTPVRSLDQEP